MDTSKEKIHQEVQLVSLYRRIKNRLVFLANKKHKLLADIVKDRDLENLKKIRQDIIR
ncbi:MAG: hypothetical protein WCN88_02010 [Candidatus Falkowbacteria bacterium]